MKEKNVIVIEISNGNVINVYSLDENIDVYFQNHDAGEDWPDCGFENEDMFCIY